METYIKRVNFLTLTAKCENAVEAFDLLQQESVDLIFCDIQMPEITGIEFVKSLKNPPLVIFTTAFSEYAVEGFNVDAVDFLLKPVAFDRFLRSVNKVKGFFNGAANSLKPELQVNHIFVKENYKLRKIKHSDIVYIEGMKDYVKIVIPEGVVITHITLKKLEELLPSTFFRAHKSFIICLDAIKAINGNTIEMINKASVPIGAQYRESLMNLLNNVN